MSRFECGAIVLLAGLVAWGGEVQEPAGPKLYTDEEIGAKYRALTPEDSDFRFEPPTTWGPNLVPQAELARVTPRMEEAARAVDGQPASTWTAKDQRGRAEFVVDLGEDRRFDRLVVFNRQTDQRGTGGGNNAVKQMALSAATRESPDRFQPIGEYVIEGPFPVCFKRKSGGQVCAFIDRTEPNVVEFTATTAQFVKVELQEAFWGETALPEWKVSIAVSEVMLFDSRGRASR